MTFISRRELLKRAAAIGAVPLAGGGLFDGRRDADRRVLDAAQSAARREPLENLTAAEMDVLEAVVARLIPGDDTGPGAREARAAHYIDRALGGALAPSRSAYAAGLASLDAYARSSRGKAFVDLAPADQDAVLTDVEAGTASGFANAREFFAMVLNHTHQGTFGDPYYGGNANFAGWDLIGYPGVRTMVSAADQERLEHHALQPARKSAYDYDAFTKAGAK
jgi:gluconate 2-dehydrogenase gamma chain